MLKLLWAMLSRYFLVLALLHASVVHVSLAFHPLTIDTALGLVSVTRLPIVLRLTRTILPTLVWSASLLPLVRFVIWVLVVGFVIWVLVVGFVIWVLVVRFVIWVLVVRFVIWVLVVRFVILVLASLTVAWSISLWAVLTRFVSTDGGRQERQEAYS
jgi:hypothetical protein